MIESKKDFKEYITYEYKKYKLNSPKVKIFPIKETDILWKYQYLMRKTELYNNTRHFFLANIYKYFFYRMSYKYNMIIPINTFDKGLKIMHIGPILVAGNARIGRDCYIHTCTAIAASGINGETPKLGNEIVLSVGAKIIGNVELADNIMIGANALVNKSFYEENIAIAGVPAKKISDNGTCIYRLNDKLINNLNKSKGINMCI